MDRVRKGREIEARAVAYLEQRGYVVHRTARNAVRRNGRWYSPGNDVWGCIDILAKRHGERVRFIQVTGGGRIAQKRRDLAAVPWDPQWECVEIWQWVHAAGNAAPAHFQTYLLDEDFVPDPVNRIFL